MEELKKFKVELENIKKENEELKEQLNLVKQENEDLKVKLKSYTNRPSKNKNYYERHKEVLLEKKRLKYEETKLKE